MKSWQAAIIGLLACTGCNQTPPTHYTVYISSDFDDAQQATIVDVLNTWEAAAKNYGLSFAPQISGRSCWEGNPCDDGFSIEPAKPQAIADEPGGQPGFVGLTAYHTSWARIWIAQPLGAEEFRTTVAHEVGHAMSASHDYEGHKTSVMFPSFGKDVAANPTCKDVAVFGQNRGMHAFCGDIANP